MIEKIFFNSVQSTAYKVGAPIISSFLKIRIFSDGFPKHNTATAQDAFERVMLVGLTDNNFTFLN